MSEIKCHKCNGNRLKKEILNIQFNQLNISELSYKTIDQATIFFENLKDSLPKNTLHIIKPIISQLLSKLKALQHIGLGYLSINRASSSLSGGEAQRLKIAAILTSELCGITYILDEPTIGLHSRDTQNLIHSIEKLKTNGNTIIIVEHDPEMISMADHIIDLGPGAGNRGGEIIAQGSLKDILSEKKSITGKYLSELPKQIIRAPENLQKGIQIQSAQARNLKAIDINIPSGGITTITGVSGSGKTTLAFEVIANSFYAASPINCQEISFTNIDSIVVMDQQKIGSSPLSTIATYTGLFDSIRDIFAQEALAKQKKFQKSHFSFNSKQGSCKNCKGMGQTKVSLDFLSDVWVICDACQGKRYKEEILEIKYKEHSIADLLDLSISQAFSLFQKQALTSHHLKILEEVGLGYIKLGQATNTLSGGEIQRLKLAKELIKETKGKTLYIFDEPSTGLHMQDVEILIKVFRKLRKNGNTILMIEHHLDIIRASDWIVDLGPEGGENGGKLLYSGPTIELHRAKESYTAQKLI